MASKKNLLPFIKNKDLHAHVEKVLIVAKKSLADSEKKFHKNSVDPFSALFDAIWQNIPMAVWLDQEKSRQNQKTLQNALGDFHQNILGSVHGFENMGTGKGKVFDIKNNTKKILAEVKNKHNTTKGNHKVAIYDDLKAQLKKPAYKGYTAYYVEVIPKSKKVYNKPFTPSDNRTGKRRSVNEHIRQVDGKSFYTLATGDPEALRKLYEVLPKVIGRYLDRSIDKAIKDPSFKELFNRIY